MRRVVTGLPCVTNKPLNIVYPRVLLFRSCKKHKVHSAIILVLIIGKLFLTCKIFFCS